MSDGPIGFEIVGKKGFLQTLGLLRDKGGVVELKPQKPGEVLTQMDIGRVYSQRDKDTKTVLGWASDKQLHKLAEEIRTERAKLPKFWYAICTNKNCGFRFGFNGPDSHEGSPCLICNSQRFKDGGRYREMSKAEVEQWEADKAANLVRVIAQMKEETRLRSEDFKRRVALGEFR